MAYAGGVWYVITNFIFGPLSRLIQGDVLLKEQELQVLDKDIPKIDENPVKLEKLDDKEDKPYDTARPLKSENEES